MKTSVVLLALSLALSASAAPQTPHNEVRQFGGFGNNHFGGGNNNSGNRNNNDRGRNNGGGNKNNNQNAGVCTLYLL